MRKIQTIINLSLVSIFLTSNPGFTQEVSEESPASVQENPSAEQVEPNTQEVSEESPGTLQDTTYPEQVDPSANPLLFPTSPEEVRVDGTTPITLQQALEIGLRNNRDLQLARLELEKSQSALREAIAALFPTLDLNLNFSYLDSSQVQNQNEQIRQNNQAAGLPLDSGTLDTDSLAFDTDIELAYNLYSGGERGATITRARRSVRFNELQVELTAEETRFNVTRAYYDLQNRDAQVAVAQAAVEDATQSLRDARLREEAGLGTKFDVLQAEVDLANASQQLTRAISDQRIARRRLADVLSLAQTVELSSAEEATEAGTWQMSLEESIVLAYKNRAELEQLLIRREIGEQDRQIALSQVRPNLDAFANYNVLDSDVRDDLPVVDGYAFGLRLRWRLFDGGAAFARADQATKDIEIAETEFAQRRNTVRLEVETAYYELIANQDNIGTARKAVETAAERLRLARLRLESGVGTQTEVIDAQRDLTEARGNVIQAIIGYNQSLNSLQRAVSNLPDNRLFEAP